VLFDARFFELPERQRAESLSTFDWVGFVGAENIDPIAGKLEMKKLGSEPGLQGKGIGKRATFGFIYYVFMIRNLNKVYIHSRDINIRCGRQTPGCCSHGFVQIGLVANFFASED
jgi:RimJ/RimL family protein N-acetyltransferase